MKYFAHIYQVYTSWQFLIVRGVGVLILSYLAYLSWETKVLFPYLLFLTQFLITSELFVFGKIGHMMPDKTIPENPSDLTQCCTLDALLAYQKGTRGIINILNTVEGQFFLTRFGVEKQMIPQIFVDQQQLLRTAYELATEVKGKYILRMDLLASYLLLIEEQSQTLFNLHLKREDLLVLLSWVRMAHPEEENPQPFRVRVSGRGIGDAVVSGWTPETQKYTQEFYYSSYQRPHLFSREAKYEELIGTLQKPENNNVLLVGDIGVGKESIIKAFAFDTESGNLTEKLNFRRILELMVGQLLAGAANRADLETRLQTIIQEVSHSYNVLLYIPALENILGNPTFQVNIAEALLPYLKNGKLPVIATMTQAAYKQYLENSPAREAFTVITISEPDKQTALHILCEKVEDLEKRTGVKIRYQALRESIRLSDSYAQDVVLPGSAINLLEDSIRYVRQRVHQTRQVQFLEESDVAQTVGQKGVATALPPSQEEKKTLLSLEDKLQERIIGQQHATVAIAEAVRRIRSNIEPPKKPISFLFLGPTGVGKTETAKALASVYFGGEGKMLRFDMSEFRGAEGVARLIGMPGGNNGRGELTEAVRDHPSSLILLDEFEKADRDVLNLLLPVLDDGRLTDALGRVVSFKNAIIIATSNAGAEFIREKIQAETQAEQLKTDLLEFLQTQGLYTPELLNRFDDVIMFEPLSAQEQIEVTKLMLASLTKYLEEQDFLVSFDQSILGFIATHGANNQFGARPLRRYIQDTIEDALAKMKLQDMLQRGSKVVFSVENEEIIYTISK